eukprot:TRINITY_DN10746_c0_g1_i3.p2 TRINITY_DN10746_c0_g1~~TRINITY_DN10746_c0_g1_i3.p2  ORF type:complete len:117 (-),score=27.56 TRINITY_DN10746_c0_g1_i3:115-465(-)
MQRDIVQFVAFNDYKDDHFKLAEKTLEEIPKQIVSYMTFNNIRPKREEEKKEKGLNFFEAQRKKFSESLLEMGFTEEKINEILDKGLPEYNTSLFKIHAFNPYFSNKLTECNLKKP